MIFELRPKEDDSPNQIYRRSDPGRRNTAAYEKEITAIIVTKG